MLFLLCSWLFSFYKTLHTGVATDQCRNSLRFCEQINDELDCRNLFNLQFSGDTRQRGGINRLRKPATGGLGPRDHLRRLRQNNLGANILRPLAWDQLPIVG